MKTMEQELIEILASERGLTSEVTEEEIHKLAEEFWSSPDPEVSKPRDLEKHSMSIFSAMELILYLAMKENWSEY